MLRSATVTTPLSNPRWRLLASASTAATTLGSTAGLASRHRPATGLSSAGTHGPGCPSPLRPNADHPSASLTTRRFLSSSSSPSPSHISSTHTHPHNNRRGQVQGQDLSLTTKHFYHSSASPPGMYTASFAFFEALAEAGVSHVFVNLGSDHPSIIEAMVKGQRESKDTFPRIITCPNEVCIIGDVLHCHDDHYYYYYYYYLLTRKRWSPCPWQMAMLA